MDATDVSVLAASSTVEVDSDPVIGVKMEIDDGKDEVCIACMIVVSIPSCYGLNWSSSVHLN